MRVSERPAFNRRRSEIPYVSESSSVQDEPPMIGEMLSSKERGDKYHAAFLIMYLQGIGVLFPWNAFITCTNYYNLRFAGTSVATSYESIFTTSFTLVGLVTIVALQWAQECVSIRSRVVGGLLTQTLVFTVASALAIQPLTLSDAEFEVDRRERRAHLGVLVGCLCVAGMAQAVLTGSLMAYASVFNSPRYFQAISAGMGVAGLTVALANFGTIASEAPVPNATLGGGGAAAAASVAHDRGVVHGAALYFIFSLVLQVSASCRSRCSRNCRSPSRASAASPAATPTPSPAPRRSRWPTPPATTPRRPTRPPSARWALCSGAVAVGRELAPDLRRVDRALPAYTATIVASEGTAEWRRLFGALLFVVFNFGDTVGRNLPCSLRSRVVVLSLVVARALFGPLFYLCRTSVAAAGGGAKPEVDSDAFPLVVMLIFAVSNGWLTTCAFMHAPSDVAPTERKRAGTLMVMFLNAGLTCGSLLSFAVKGLTCNCNPFVS